MTLQENRIIFYSRAWFVVIFVLPLSLLWSLLSLLYKKYSNFMRLKSKHSQRVKYIQKQVKLSNGNKLMCTSRPGYKTMSLRVGKYKSYYQLIDLNDMVHILELNKNKSTIIVEPLVTVGDLTEYLVDTGYTLAVVPELDDLTFGGLLSGFGVESSSHKYGLLQHIVLSVDIILGGNGELVHCSPYENQELFECIPWSHGTLGFIVAIELKLVKCTDYIKLEYEVYNDLNEFSNTLEKLQTNYEFIEGLVYSNQHAVLMKGNFTNDTKTYGINYINRWYNKWFYEHVKEQKTGNVEVIPLRDYYHRHTKSLFWTMEDIIPFGNAIWFRYLLGWASPPKVSLLKITTPKILINMFEKYQMHQDWLIPMSNLAEFFQVLHNQVKFYPLWICPMLLKKTRGLVSSKDEETMFVDVGVYGTPQVDTWNHVKTTRNIEQYVRDHNGFQALYADTYQTETEFNQMFNHTLWEKLREKYNCNRCLPTIFDKVNKTARN